VGIVLELLGAYFGASFGLLGASWCILRLLGTSREPLGASWELLGAEGSDIRFVAPVLGSSWGPCLGSLLGPLGRLFGRLGALLGSLGALLGASWAVLGQSRVPLEPL